MSTGDLGPAASMASAATRRVLSRVRRMIPPMLDVFHKGQLGRVAVIGGSQNYTGAPFFSAMASARLGCDLSHVICTPEAGAVIKTYSPDLMVHPLMRQSPRAGEGARGQAADSAERIAAPIIDLLSRLHVLVVGPGLGRDPLMQAIVACVVDAARSRNMPVVVDADALQLVQHRPGLVRGFAGAVLTPNVVEFARLWDALELDEGAGDGDAVTGRVETLAKALGGVTIIQKGKTDFISNGTSTLANDLAGSRKRSGGQGDTLTGSVATFLAWRKAYLDGLWDTGDDGLSADELMGLAAFGGSAVTRESSRLAFLTRGRSLQASDLTGELHNALLGLFGDVDGNPSSPERSS